MKRIWAIGIIVVLLGMLISCKSEDKEDKNTKYYIYYLNSSEDQLVREKFVPSTMSKEDLIKELLDGLGKEPSNILYRKVKTTDIVIKNFNINTNGKLTLQFGAGYSKLSGVKEVLSRAAIVKTVLQVDSVDYVEFEVDGQPLLGSDGKSLGFMTGDDFIANSETTYMQAMFFSNKDGTKLVEIPIEIAFDGTIPIEKLVIQQLIQGPYIIDGIDKDKVRKTIPDGTKLNSVTVKDQICYVDFNEAFLNPVADVNSKITLYSMVNAIVELPSVNTVQFTINGKTVKSFGDNINFDVQFERDLDIVESQD